MFAIWTEDVIYSCQNIGGTHELVEIFLMHGCMQSDLGEPKSWEEALDGTKCEWSLKLITDKVKKNIRRGGWELFHLNVLLRVVEILHLQN